jgi:hypothetical protein
MGHNDDLMAFVQSKSPNGDDDLLPGLVLFTEAWLDKVSVINSKRGRGVVNVDPFFAGRKLIIFY